MKERAQEIAAKLPGEWQVHGLPEDYATSKTAAYLVRKDGLRLHIREGGYQQKGRIVIDLNYPQDHEGRMVTIRDLPYDGRNGFEYPQITVAGTKQAAEIARDIERRLIPSAEKVHAALLAVIAGRKKYDDNVERDKALFGSRVGWYPHDKNNGSLQGGEFYGKVRVHGDGTASLEVGSVPIETAIKFLNLLAHTKKTE